MVPVRQGSSHQRHDAKIEDQEEFVRWWNENVRRAGNSALHPINADRSFLTREDAEASTGIRQQQVSRWRKRLADKPKYRERLIFALAHR
jgi:hypothetical protein